MRRYRRTEYVMLHALTLVEEADLPTLPEPRQSTKEKMLAIAALMEGPINLWPHEGGMLPKGCWLMPQGSLALYGTACRRPLMFNEVREISRATGLSGIVVRHSEPSGDRSQVSFDVHMNGAFHMRHLLWISASGGTGWLVRDLGDGPYIRLSRWGLEKTDQPPFVDIREARHGLQLGAEYLNTFMRGR